MPATLLLDEFGSQVWHAFGTPPYLVGSALAGKQWRDVDVRLILDDETYAALGLGDPRPSVALRNGKWVGAMFGLFCARQAITGLPIDFQIQQQTQANKAYEGEQRSAIGLIALRLKD
jgi:hypothetical protein